jgi:hypothetical protein
MKVKGCDARRALAVTVLLIIGTSRILLAQAAAIPLALGVNASSSETTAGAAVRVRVTLKNYSGVTVVTPEPVAITIHSALTADATVAIPAGQSSAVAEVRFQRAGIARIVATAPALTSGSVVVVAKAPDGDAGMAAPRSPAEREALAQPRFVGFAPAPGAATEHPHAVEPLTPGSGSAPNTGLTLGVDVLPRHVHRAAAQWRALVLVTTLNANRQPAAVSADTPVHLATDFGVVTPAYSHVDAGKARVAETIQVSSDRPGTGTLWAWTDTGRLTATAVEYHDALPSQLLVKGSPGRAVNSGKTPIVVTVFLQDETAAMACADSDVAVKLTSSMGTASPSDLTIPKGKFFAEAVLTSATAGTAEITATGPKLKTASARVYFVFPWLLVALAAAGGVIGAVVKAGGETFVGAWWWHLLGHVGTGIVLGLVFYALVLFGVVASIPQLAIPLGQLPTTNELGAVILGFFGGYLARAWLPTPEQA